MARSVLSVTSILSPGPGPSIPPSEMVASGISQRLTNNDISLHVGDVPPILGSSFKRVTSSIFILLPAVRLPLRSQRVSLVYNILDKSAILVTQGEMRTIMITHTVELLAMPDFRALVARLASASDKHSCINTGSPIIATQSVCQAPTVG